MWGREETKNVGKRQKMLGKNVRKRQKCWKETKNRQDINVRVDTKNVGTRQKCWDETKMLGRDKNVRKRQKC